MKIIPLLLTLLAFQFINSQSLVEIGLQGKSNIVVKKPIKIDLENYVLEIRAFMSNLEMKKVDFDKKDTTIVKRLIEKVKISEPNYNDWTSTELPTKILIGKENYISVKKGLEIIPWKTKTDKKRIKKEIRKYNNRGTEWRSYPIAISRPIYSMDKTYALISFINGNNGGNVSLYKNNDGKWTYVDDVLRWAY